MYNLVCDVSQPMILRNRTATEIYFKRLYIYRCTGAQQVKLQLLAASGESRYPIGFKLFQVRELSED